MQSCYEIVKFPPMTPAVTFMDIITQGNTIYGIHPEYTASFRPEHFDPAWWKTQNAVTGQSTGRGITWFVKLAQRELVLRHYYRGGMIGRLLNDRYLYNNLQNSRAFAEFRLLEWMRNHGLPVPKPCAVRLIRNGLFYRTDILLKRIPDAQDLVKTLGETALTGSQWQTIGHVIRQFHDAGIYHSDLNSHNIMLDVKGQVWLIDFDKSRHRADGAWKETNLARLLRSFRKERSINPDLHWQESNWQTLLEGYGKNGSSS